MDHGVDEAWAGTPKQLLKLGYRVGFVDDEEVWLDMLDKCKKPVYEYDKEGVEDLIQSILVDYNPTFEKLAEVLREKVAF